MFVLTWATHAAGLTQANYTNVLLEIDADAPRSNSTWVMKTVLSVMIGGVAASPYFARNVRHPKTG